MLLRQTAHHYTRGRRVGVLVCWCRGPNYSYRRTSGESCHTKHQASRAAISKHYNFAVLVSLRSSVQQQRAASFCQKIPLYSEQHQVIIRVSTWATLVSPYVEIWSRRYDLLSGAHAHAWNGLTGTACRVDRASASGGRGGDSPRLVGGSRIGVGVNKTCCLRVSAVQLNRDTAVPAG